MVFYNKEGWQNKEQAIFPVKKRLGWRIVYIFSAWYDRGMAELNTKYNCYPKRVILPEGKQKRFLKRMQDQLNLTLKEFAKLAGVHVRTMTDWKREKFSMSLPALKRICREAKVPLPKNIETKDPFWYVNKGAKVGGLAVYKKYGRIGGDPEYRKKKWCEWWEREGRFRKHPLIGACAPVNVPQKSPKLSEFVGILLGDGGITNSQIIISLNKFDDRDFVPYVKNLIQQLFNIKPSVYERENVINIVISRVKLVRFFNHIGLPSVSKVRHQVDIPAWIEESSKFTKSCLKGLFDTDGCFYVDKHRYKDRIYYNCAMNFTNRSLPVLFFFKRKLEQLGFHPTRNTKFCVCLRKEDEIKKYFQEISSFNPKHLNKFKKYFKNKYGEVPKWL